MTGTRDAALVEFVGTFMTVSDSGMDSISDLGDGVALFEALSEIAPEYFDPTTIARHLGDNWALKSSNLRKLLRNLENYFHNELKKDADFSSVNMQKMAREGDPDTIAVVAELVAAAAVTCPEKNTYVQRIMTMSPDSQMAMKEIIQQSLARLSDYEDDEENESEEEEDNEMVFGQENPETMGGEDGDDNGEKGLFGNRYDLEQQLEEARRELTQHKSLAAESVEESEKAQAKLRALVEDLQDRLMKRQDELIQVEEDLQQATSDLEDAKSKLAASEEQKAVLEDDLDVAKAKAQQLYKAEATVAAYKKKLDEVGVKNQQMEGLEGQAEKYLQQIMELEAEVKKSAALQKAVSALEEKVAKLEKEKADAASSTKNAAQEVSDLKSRLASAESARKTYEEELTELRAKQEGVAEATSAMENLSVNESKEKAMRLDIENRQLRAELEKLKSAPIAATAVSDAGSESASTPIAIAVPAANDSPEVAALKTEIQRLAEAVAAKEKENAKISGDKDKLEAYTKRTLAKFQDKYLVALQECKAKLKEKQDKIEMLEKRSASERSAQKREERLLSSTIYELGLGIMQKKLKGGM